MTSPRPSLFARSLCALATAACTLATLAAEPASSSGFSAGLSVQPTATAADIGLPLYPGAKPWRESGDEGPGATLALWGGAFGMQLKALKLRTPDKVDDVARYYRDAMAHYGKVVDCSAGAPREPEPARRDDSTLRCGSGDKPPAGAQHYKVGAPRAMRIVTVEPVAGGTQVQLVYLQIRGE